MADKIKLHTFGCSFTYGTSCIDPVNECWPARLANMLNIECINYGIEGASNDGIFKTLCNNISNISTQDIVIVMMTKSSRRFFRGKNVNPNSSGVIANKFYKHLHDEESDCLNFLQNYNAMHNILLNYKYIITFMDAKPLLEANRFSLGAVAKPNSKTYVPKNLNFTKYIENVDNLHPSTEGHLKIARDIYDRVSKLTK